MPLGVQAAPSPAETMLRVRDQASYGVIQFSAAAERTRSNPVAAIDQSRMWISDLAGLIAGPNTLSRDGARAALQLAGFIVAANEWRQLVAGQPANSGLAQLPGAEELLIALGRLGQLPPVLSYYSYWIENPLDDPLTFDGSVGAVAFHHNVIYTNRATVRCVANIMEIMDGPLGLRDPEASQRLRLDAHLQQGIHDRYQQLHTKDSESSIHSISIPDFAFNFRTRLVPLKVGGEHYGGPNAAHLPDVAILDILIGYPDQKYIEIIHDRLRFMPFEDRRRVLQAEQSSSLLDMAAETLGYSRAGLATVAPSELAAKLETEPPMRSAIVALCDLANKYNRATGFHYKLINDYLLQTAKNRPQESANAIIPVGKSVGNKDHSEPRDIMLMRKNDPAMDNLNRAVHLLDRTN